MPATFVDGLDRNTCFEKCKNDTCFQNHKDFWPPWKLVPLASGQTSTPKVWNRMKKQRSQRERDRRFNVLLKRVAKCCVRRKPTGGRSLFCAFGALSRSARSGADEARFPVFVAELQRCYFQLCFESLLEPSRDPDNLLVVCFVWFVFWIKIDGSSKLSQIP